MTAFVPTQLGVLLPSDINDLAAAGISEGEFAKRVSGAWAGVNAVEDAIRFPLPALSQYRYFNSALPSGTTVITPSIPVGYKMVLYTAQSLSNPTTGSITATNNIRRSSIDYQVFSGSIAARSSATGFVGVLNPALNLYPGDELVITASASGLVVTFVGYYYADAGAIKLFSVPLASGNNTIYTVPVGKSAFTVSHTAQSTSTVIFENFSGGTRIQSVSIDSAKMIEVSISNGGCLTNPQPQLPLTAGQSLVVATDGSGAQLFMCSVYES